MKGLERCYDVYKNVTKWDSYVKMLAKRNPFIFVTSWAEFSKHNLWIHLQLTLSNEENKEIT